MKFNDTLLPTLIDERAKSDPEKLYCVLIKGKDNCIVETAENVTYAQFANAVNRCAWWLEKTFGKQGEFPTIAYVGPNDIRYPILTLAAVKTGYKALLLNPTNPIPAQINLLAKTGATSLIVAKDFEAYKLGVAAILAHYKVPDYQLEALDHWLDPELVPLYEFTSTLHDVPDRPFVVIHTSGSTGLPEPITYRCASLAAFGQFLTPEDVVPQSSTNTSVIWKDIHCHYMPFPTSHMIGLFYLTAFAVYWDMATVVGPSLAFPTPSLITDVLNLVYCDAATLHPGLLEAMAKDPQKLERLSKLNHVVWTGAPFTSKEMADIVRSKVNIYTAYGSTETGALPLVKGEQEDFEWYEFSALCGANFEPYADDLHELVLVNKPEIRTTQFVFLNFPDLEEWRTKDLFSEHPTRKGLWKYHGRNDDMLILTNGRNINPRLTEGIVSRHPEVVSALLIGTGKAGVALLIEPKNPPMNSEERESLLSDIWPSIDEANQTSTIDSQVPKERVVFTTKDKPMKRAAKGSVQRKLTVSAYEQELNAVYDT